MLSLIKGAKEEVYVLQLPSSVVPWKKEYSYRWFKALYSLKQTPRAWIEKMDQHLKKEFVRSQAVFFPTEGDRLCVPILFDDPYITGSDLLLIEQIKAVLCQQFETSDLGKLKIQQIPGGMLISQQRFVLELLELFREKVVDGTVNLEYYPTASTRADFLTKLLLQMLLYRRFFSSSLGLFPDPGAERGC